MNHELLVCGNIARDTIFGNERYGGSASAIAINANRLGISSGLLSVVGKDTFSKQYIKYLTENHINIDLVRNSLKKLPECIVSGQMESDVNIEWIDNGCHQAMESMDIDFEKALKYSVVHLVSCPPKLAQKLAYSGLNILSYEPGPYIHTDPAYLDFAVVDRSKMVFFNEEEYQSALKVSGLKSPEDFISGSHRVLIVTKGVKGSDYYYGSDQGLQSGHVEAIKPKTGIVDTTGAGDCYKAGFLAGHIRGRSLSECALIGSYMGATCLTQEGGILPEDKIREIRKFCKI